MLLPPRQLLEVGATCHACLWRGASSSACHATGAARRRTDPAELPLLSRLSPCALPLTSNVSMPCKSDCSPDSPHIMFNRSATAALLCPSVVCWRSSPQTVQGITLHHHCVALLHFIWSTDASFPNRPCVPCSTHS